MRPTFHTDLGARHACPGVHDTETIKGEGQVEQKVQDIVFEYAYLGAQGERQSVAVLVVWVRRTQMLLAHIALRKRLVHEHG